MITNGDLNRLMRHRLQPGVINKKKLFETVHFFVCPADTRFMIALVSAVDVISVQHTTSCQLNKRFDAVFVSAAPFS